MTNHQLTPRPDSPKDTSKKRYRKPEIIEWGSVVDLTENFLNGLVDGTFGGSVTGFRDPPPPRPH